MVANGCLVLLQARTTAERHYRELKTLKNSTARLLSATGELVPLDTDISWKSDNRTSTRKYLFDAHVY
jgi:hypothetical protein